jgi:hypothetical protein
MGKSSALHFSLFPFTSIPLIDCLLLKRRSAHFIPVPLLSTNSPHKTASHISGNPPLNSYFPPFYFRSHLNPKYQPKQHNQEHQRKVTIAFSPRDIPRLTGMDDYPAWKTSITTAFFILDLYYAINPSAPAPAFFPDLPPDPFPSLTLVPASGLSTILSDAENQALTLLTAKKRECASACLAKETDHVKERPLREALEKRKDDMALGWMFLTMGAMLAQDVLAWLSKKRDSDGTPRKVELKELNARIVWEKLAEKLDPDRQR